MCSLFVAHGSRLDQADIDGLTLAHIGAKFDDVELLQMYVQHGGEINASAPSFGTPLNIALRKNIKQILPEL